jgi:hypothetical protein
MLGGPVLGNSGPVHIYLIFWGKYWDTSEGRAVSDQMLHAVDPVLYYNPYLDSLHQYGVNYRAYNDPRPGTGQGAVVDDSEPQSGFHIEEAFAVVFHALQDGLPREDNAIYFVVTPPPVRSDDPMAGAYHSYSTVSDSGRTVPVYWGWIGSDGTMDHYTRLLSHETVEAMTDPRLDGWRDRFVPPPENEIADNYTYRLNGYLVQAYWSQGDGAFRVNDGTSQTFYVQQDPNIIIATKDVLTINGDQLGYGYGDTIAIDVNADGGVSVTLNGEVVNFDLDQISSIVANTGAGANTVYVLNVPQGVNVTINDGGDDYVGIGSQGSVQGILGSVQVNSPANHTQLVINDSADPVAQRASIDDSSVIGLAPGNIGFNSNGLSYLMIFAGPGGNTFFINNTPSTFNGVGPGFTWLDTGAGLDTVDVTGTTGRLYVNGRDGHDRVYIGTDSGPGDPVPGNGTLAGINGSVDVFNTSGVTNLFVDDGGDAVGHTATLTGSSLTGLSAGTIYWTPTASFTGGVEYLQIYGSAAASTYNVTDTPDLTYYTVLETGAGNDIVNITGTTGSLAVYNRGGADTVSVGNGTLAGINGSVNVSGAGSTQLYVLDYNDPTARSATLTGTSLTGLSGGTIGWTASPTAVGGVTFLSIAGSAAGSTYYVTDTPSLFNYTDLATGSGDDVVSVTGTTGAFVTENLGGTDRVYVGNGTLAGINGGVSVVGSGSTYLYVEDYADTTAHSATLTGNRLTGLSPGAIGWLPTVAATGGVTFLEIMGSAAGSTYTVADTPNLYYYTNLNTGAGGDAVYLTGTTGALLVYNGGGADTVVFGRKPTATSGGKVGAIKGWVDVYGAGSTALTVDDSGDATGRSATLTGFSLTGLAPAEIDYGTGVTSLTINGGKANDTLTVAGIPTGTKVTFKAGGGSDTLVGPNTSNFWELTGIGAGNINGGLFFTGVENLVGGTSLDTFWFGGSARVSTINGGGAPAGQGDWLDYAAYPMAVSVNLATGTATGVAGTVSGIQNVFGGNHGNKLTGNAQGNILIGGNAADTIIGGSGRSLLIGGPGNDTIIGGAADDIIIGDHAAYDSSYHLAYQEVALMSILAEWQSADSYATRVSNLQSGPYPLARGNTVTDDGGTDKLTGGGGLDWFFADGHDTVADRQVGEVVN